jgi:hypothetical protein
MGEEVKTECTKTYRQENMLTVFRGRASQGKANGTQQTPLHDRNLFQNPHEKITRNIY